MRGFFATLRMTAVLNQNDSQLKNDRHLKNDSQLKTTAILK